MTMPMPPFRLRQALLLSCALWGGTMGVALALPAAAQTNTHAFKIPSQSLADALRAFATQSGRDVLFAPGIVAGKVSPGVAGTLGEVDALRALLAGTGLTFQVTSANGYAVLAQSAAAGPAKAPPVMSEGSNGANDTSSSDEGTDSSSSGNVEKVTVTGSRIRGAKQAAPVITITQDDMRKQGATDIGQAVRALPQSFAGGQNPGVTAGSAGIDNQNVTGGSSINLRGIGPDGTLVLLNGTRLPYDGFSQATDVAVIPVAAINRVEILLDGASAIYGSDAIGGVANIILKRDYDGAEFSARWGEATQGGFEQHQYTGVAGTVWDSGGFIAAADFNDNSAVRAGQRDYLTDVPARNTTYPSSRQTGALFSGHQQILDTAELNIDAFYTKREGNFFLDFTLFGFTNDGSRESEVWGVTPSLRFQLPDDWSLRLTGVYGENSAHVKQTLATPSGDLIDVSDTTYINLAEAVTAESEGPLFELGGGEARLALGAGLRRNHYNPRNNDPTGNVNSIGRSRSVHAYGEVYLPLVGEEQDIPFVNRFALSGAIRYESYDSFGETTTPKVGAIWGLTKDIDLKATWGKSFKAPTLNQLSLPSDLALSDEAFIGIPPGQQALILGGGNPNLRPEKAETVTLGFKVRPEFAPGLEVEISRFHIDYTDRVIDPYNTLSNALGDSSRFMFVTFNPTLAQQNAAFAAVGQAVGTFNPPATIVYDPAAVVAIIDNRKVNAAAQKISGVDLNTTYTFGLLGGDFTASGGASWLESTQKLTSLAQEQGISGVVFYPAETKWRLGGSWTSDGFTASATLNQTGGVRNNLVPANTKGDPFTTLDLVIDYVLESGPLGGEMQFNLGVQNLFDEDPPFMEPTFFLFENFDSTNYSSLGRVVNLSVTQRF